MQIRSGGYQHALQQPSLGANQFRHTCSTDLRATDAELDVLGSYAARLQRLLSVNQSPGCSVPILLIAMTLLMVTTVNSMRQSH